MNELKRYDTFEISGIRTMDWYDADEVDAYIAANMPKECECDATETRIGLKQWLAMMDATHCPYCGGKIKEVNNEDKDTA